jgi:hypothetical protein
VAPAAGQPRPCASLNCLNPPAPSPATFAAHAANLEAQLSLTRNELSGEVQRRSHAHAQHEVLLLLWAIAGEIERAGGVSVWDGPALSEDAEAAAAYYSLAAAGAEASVAPPTTAATVLDARAAAVYAQLLRVTAGRSAGEGAQGGAGEENAGGEGQGSGGGSSHTEAERGRAARAEGGGGGSGGRARRGRTASQGRSASGGRSRARSGSGGGALDAASAAVGLVAQSQEPSRAMIGAVGVTTSQFIHRCARVGARST